MIGRFSFEGVVGAVCLILVDILEGDRGEKLSRDALLAHSLIFRLDRARVR